MKNLMAIFIAAGILLSCSAKNMESEDSRVDDETAVAEESSDGQTITPLTDNSFADFKSKLIKKAVYRFQVDNVKECTEFIEAALARYPAYVSSSNLKLENPILENSMKIRVQSQYFEMLLKEIDGQAKFVNFRKIETNDVAKEFIDLESRLKTKREVEARYAEILRVKAGTITEVLEAEAKIGELHEEIEATISRVNFLKDQVSYSTIDLEYYQTITQHVAKVDAINWGERFMTGLQSGVTGILTVALALVYLWPLLTIALVSYFAYKFFSKRKTALVR